jgi:hypothetical protein
MLAWLSSIFSWPFTGNSSKSKGKRRREETNVNQGNYQRKRTRSQYSNESENKPMDPKRSSQRTLFPTEDHFGRPVLSSYDNENTPQFKVQLSRSQDEMVPIPKSLLNPAQLEASNIDSKMSEAMYSLSILRGKAGSLQSQGKFHRSQALQADRPAQFHISPFSSSATGNLGSYHPAHRTESSELVLRQKEQQAEKNRLKDEEDEKRRAQEAERKIAE